MMFVKLKNNGHDIQVITGKPNYPKGKIFKGYKKNNIKLEKYKNFNVYRVPLHPRGNSSKFELIKNYISFIYNGIFYGSKI